MPYPQDLLGKYLRFPIASSINIVNAGHTPSLVNGLLTGQDKPVSAQVHDGPVPTPITPAPIAAGSKAWAKPTMPGAPPIVFLHGGPAAPATAPAIPKAPGALSGHRVNAPGGWASAKPTAASKTIKAPGTLGAARVDTFSFAWLPYVAGATTIATVGTGSLTGPMSGCFLFTYLDNGVRKFAHVGTYDQPGDQYSVSAKTAWVDYNKAFPQANAMGGSPADLFDAIARKNASLQPAVATMMPKVLGYATPNGDIWSILAAPVPEALSPVPGAKDFLYISAVTKMNLQPWLTIAPRRTFQLHGATGDEVSTGIIKLR